MREYRVDPSKLCGLSALMTAERTPMRKMKGERDTEFVKRIVAMFLTCCLGSTNERVLAQIEGVLSGSPNQPPVNETTTKAAKPASDDA